MKAIVAKNGFTFYVSEDHPLLSKGIFLTIDPGEGTEMSLDFLMYAFGGTTRFPVKHARMASFYGLRDLARTTIFTHIESIYMIPEDLENLFAWHELPDRLAMHMLRNPSSEDLSLIVELEYLLCYKKFFHDMDYSHYKNLKFSFLDTVIKTIGIRESFTMCCANGYLEMAKYLVSLCVIENAKGGEMRRWI